MKKINSIGYGHTILLAAALFLLILPAILYIASLLIHLAWIVVLIRTSIAIGLVILLFLVVLLAIELHQDKRINHDYLKHRNRKVQINGFTFECQACGNRNVSENDRRCNVCGCQYEE